MKTLKDADDLVRAGLIDREDIPKTTSISQTYSIGVTSQVIDTIKNSSFDDAIYKQYIPDVRELDSTDNETPDPIGDHAHEVTKGLIHRYPDRVLFKITPTCAVYCRFCFRREMVGRGKDALTAADIEAALDYIADTPQIREVILSGGDPLILSPRRLNEVISRLENIPHISLIRFHTRVPVAKPDLISQDLLHALTTSKQMIFVLHINHAQELNHATITALKSLRKHGTVLSQSVLLKGVNDNIEALKSLFIALTDIGVQPYYLHHPDKAQGTAHFRLTIQEGRALYKALRGQLSGYALPHYVLDIPDGYGKVPLNGDWIAPHGDGGYTVTDIHGKTHRYYD